MFSQVSVYPRGGGLCPGGLCHGDPPLRQYAGGTHPTGMHSCLIHDFIFENWGGGCNLGWQVLRSGVVIVVFDEEDHLCISKSHKITQYASIILIEL